MFLNHQTIPPPAGGRVLGSATPGHRQHFKAGLGGLPPDFSSRAGTQTQDGPFPYLIRGRFTTVFNIAFSFSLITASCAGGSPAHAFSFNRPCPPFILSASLFLALPVFRILLERQGFFTGFLSLLVVLILSHIGKNHRAGGLPGLAVIAP